MKKFVKVIKALSNPNRVKIVAFLGLEPRLYMKYEFNWAGKIEHFSKVSVIYSYISIFLFKNYRVACVALRRINSF